MAFFNKRMILLFTNLFLLAGIGTTIANYSTSEFQGAATGEVEVLLKTISFETSENFANDTSYTGTKDKGTEQWRIYQGNSTTTSTAVSSGSQGILMRSYHEASGSKSAVNPFAYMNFNLSKVTKVVFSAKQTNALQKINVFYSSNSATTTVTGTGLSAAATDSGTWSSILSEQTLTTTHTDYQATISLTGEFANVRLKFQASRAYGALTSTNYDLGLDNIRIYGMVSFGTLTDLAITTNSTDLIFYVGEKFSAPNLVLTAYDAENQGGISKIVTPTAFDPAIDYVFTSGDISNSKVITISYSESEVTLTETYTISVLMVDTTEDNLSILVSDFTTASYAANNGEKTKNAADGSVTIKYLSNQVYQANSFIQFQATNGYIYNISDLVSIDRIVIDLGAGSSNLVIKEGTNISQAQTGSTISPSSNGNLRIYQFSQTKGYFYISNGGSTSTILSIKVYTDTSVSSASTFINNAMFALDSVCSGDGNSNTTNLESTWTTLSADYAALSADVKNYIYDNADESTVSAFRTRYQFIRGKYAYTNFLVNSSNVALYNRNPNIDLTSQSIENLPSTIMYTILITLLISFLYNSKKKLLFWTVPNYCGK